MTAYSFKARFAEPIIAGTKGGTIRAPRNGRPTGIPRPGGHARPGEMLQLYTGMRTQQCRRIADKRCLAVAPILLFFGGLPEIIVGPREDGLRYRSAESLDCFARFDGFDNFDQMAGFWDSDAFNGWHIRWLPLPLDLDPSQ